MTLTTKELASMAKFPQEVRDTVVALINTHDIRCRMPDGNHLYLYNGDRSTYPFKIAASRPVEQTMRKLRPWIERNVPEFYTPTSTEQETTQVTTIDTTEPSTPTREFVVLAQGKPTEKTMEYLYHHPDGYIACTACDYTSRTLQGIHLHENKHNGTAQVNAHKGGKGNADKVAMKQAEARTHLLALAKALGVDLLADADEVTALKAEVAELKAKITLIKEAMSL